MVEPATPGPLATLVVVKSALELTPRTAVTVAELVPTEVVKEPEAIVFVTVPATELVTTAVSVQLEAWGINVPTGSVKDPAPATADTNPALQPVVVVTAGVVLTSPAG